MCLLISNILVSGQALMDIKLVSYLSDFEYSFFRNNHFYRLKS